MALGTTPQEIVDSEQYQLLTKAANWDRIPLSFVATVQNGFAFKSAFFDRHSGLPLIRIRDITKLNTEHKYTGDYSDEYIVRRGDILVGMDGDFTAAKWRGEEALLNQRVCRLSLGSQFYDEKFFFLSLQPFLNAINAETSSVTVKHLSSRTLSEIPLPLPPLDEQKRIVAKIEELFSELDKGVESLKAARAQLTLYRQAILKHAFEGKLTADWREANKDKLETPDQLLTRIKKEREAHYEKALGEWQKALEIWEKNGKEGKKPGRPLAPAILEELDKQELARMSKLPKGWAWKKIGELFDVFVGATPSRKNPDYWNGEINWVSSGEVNFSRIKDTTEKITEAGYENTSTNLHPPGTILLGMIGEGKTRGQCAILSISACHNQNSAAIRVSEHGHPPEYVYYFFQYQYEITRLLGSGNNQKALNKSRVQNIPIPLVNLSEQLEVVNKIENIFSQVLHIEEQISKDLARTQALRQSILKKAFSGQLVPQDPKDEPASVLLERIKSEQAATEKPKRKTTKRKKKVA